MAKPETFDCVAMKRSAQRSLAKALAGKSPAMQVETLHRLAAKSQLWNSLAKPQARPRAVRPHGKRRSIA